MVLRNEIRSKPSFLNIKRQFTQKWNAFLRYVCVKKLSVMNTKVKLTSFSIVCFVCRWKDPTITGNSRFRFIAGPQADVLGFLFIHMRKILMKANIHTFIHSLYMFTLPGEKLPMTYHGILNGLDNHLRSHWLLLPSMYSLTFLSEFVTNNERNSMVNLLCWLNWVLVRLLNPQFVSQRNL